MSLQSSRYHGQEVVNSFNLFVDTEKSSVVGDGQSKAMMYTYIFKSNLQAVMVNISN